MDETIFDAKVAKTVSIIVHIELELVKVASVIVSVQNRLTARD